MSETLRIEGWHELLIVIRGRETFYDDENAMITFDSKEEAQDFIDERSKTMAKKVIRRSKGKAPKVTGPKPKVRKSATFSAADPKAVSRKTAPKRMDEAALKAKYSHVVSGTLKFDKAAGKQTIEIKCKKRGCDVRRRIFTSDLFQIDMCEEHTLERRATRRAEARKAKAS